MNNPVCFLSVRVQVTGFSFLPYNEAVVQFPANSLSLEGNYVLSTISLDSVNKIGNVRGSYRKS